MLLSSLSSRHIYLWSAYFRSRLTICINLRPNRRSHRPAAITCKIPPVSSSSRRSDVSSVSDIRVCPIARKHALTTEGVTESACVLFRTHTFACRPCSEKCSRESDALLRIPTSAGASLEALSPKFSTQSHGRLVTGDPGTVRPDESRETDTKSATPS